MKLTPFTIIGNLAIVAIIVTSVFMLVKDRTPKIGSPSGGLREMDLSNSTRWGISTTTYISSGYHEVEEGSWVVKMGGGSGDDYIRIFRGDGSLVSSEKPELYIESEEERIHKYCASIAKDMPYKLLPNKCKK